MLIVIWCYQRQVIEMGLMNYLIFFNSWVFKNWIKKIRWSGAKYNSSIFLISARRFFLLYTNDYEQVRLNRFMSQKPPWGHFPLGSPGLSIDNTSVRTSERNTWVITRKSIDFWTQLCFPRFRWFLPAGGTATLARTPPLASVCGHFLWAVQPGTMGEAGEPLSDANHWLLPPIPGTGTSHTCLHLSLSICGSSCLALRFASNGGCRCEPGSHHLCWTLHTGLMPRDYDKLWGLSSGIIWLCF